MTLRPYLTILERLSDDRLFLQVPEDVCGDFGRTLAYVINGAHFMATEIDVRMRAAVCTSREVDAAAQDAADCALRLAQALARFNRAAELAYQRRAGA